MKIFNRIKKLGIRTSILLIICAFLLLQFKLADKNIGIKYQQDISLLLEKEAQEQYFYIEKQIVDRLDWYNQISEQVFNKQAMILQTDRDPMDVLIRRCEALIKDLEKTTDLSVQKNEFESLKIKASQIPVDNKKGRKALFLKLVDLRRKVSFSNPLLDFNRAGYSGNPNRS